MPAIPRPFSLARPGTIYPQYDEPDALAAWLAHVEAGRIAPEAVLAARGAISGATASTSSTSAVSGRETTPG